FDERRVALAPVVRRGGGGDPVDGAQSRCDGYRVATLFDEHVERLQHARRDPGRREGVPARDRITVTGDVFQLGLARVQLKAVEDENAGNREANRRNSSGSQVDETCPATPGPVFGVTVVDQPLWQQPETVDALAEHCE